MVTVLKNLLTMSLSGSIVILLVLALRLVLKKAPARLVCLLWLLAGLRLVLPFHIEADFSLQPDTQQLLQSVVSDQVFAPQEYAPQEYAPQEYVPQDIVPAMPTVGENITINTDSGVTTQVQRTVDWVAVAAYVWAVGVAVMLVYAAVSYVRLKRQVRAAVRMDDGTWECRNLEGAFLLGYLKPKIFIPAHITGNDREYVISHERNHLAWGDHWTKLVGFLCLSLHWFNPLVWLAYWFLCKDLETACDEQVVKGYDVEQRKAYSQALLSCSSGSRPVSACPIAFGEVNVKERIMKVLNYRKPGFWICLVCVIAIISASVFFLTDPLKEMTMEDYAALIGTERSELLEKLGVDEEDVTYSETSRRYLLPDKIEFNGRQYQVYFDAGETVHNRAVSFTFISKPYPDEQTSIEDFAQEYLALQAQYTEQFGESRRTNVYTEAQQIVDAYENRRRSEVGAWVIDTPWEVYEGIPYSNIIEFLKEMLTWDEVAYLGKWHGRDMDGLLRVSLQGEYLDGSAVFKITYRADVMPTSTAVKNNIVFTKFASKLGMHKDAFLEELDAEDDVRHGTGGDIWLEPIEYNGAKWYIANTYRDVLENRVTTVEFVSVAESFDEMAEDYLSMLELLKSIYGEPTDTFGDYTDPQQLRESYEHWPNPGGQWSMQSHWKFENVERIFPEVQERMKEVAEMDYVTDVIKRLHGSDANPKVYFAVGFTCTVQKGAYRTNLTFSLWTGSDKEPIEAYQ